MSLKVFLCFLFFLLFSFFRLNDRFDWEQPGLLHGLSLVLYSWILYVR